MEKMASQRGIALLLVLWVLTILMVIALSFSFMVRTETHATVAFREGMEKRFLAEAGIERGIMEVFYRAVNRNQPVVLEGREVWRVDGSPYYPDEQLGNGWYGVRITDESGKLNLNNLNDTSAIIMRQLLSNAGVQEKEENVIVDSVLDWKDPNKGLHRLNGAGDDYYRSLPNPYEAKHADFDTVEELLLVKGVTPELLYGTDEKRGIIDLLAARPPDANYRINVNAAPREILAAIPGITPELADAIIEMRKDKDIVDINSIPGIQPQSIPFLMGGAVTSNTFAIEAVGFKDEENKGYTIKATVLVEGNNKFRYLYYKSPAKLN